MGVARGVPRLLGSIVWAGLACALAPPGAAAQGQLKPYILLVFDTSGSMDDAALDDTCGYLGSTKMSAAKCAVAKIMNAAGGDVDFGLMQFDQVDCANGNGTCDQTSGSGWLRVPIQTNSATAIFGLVDDAGAAPASELCGGGGTPLGGTLRAAREYFQGATGTAAPTVNDDFLDCRPLAVVLLTDGQECCGGCTGGGCPTADAILPSPCDTMCRNNPDPGMSTGSGCYFETAPERAYELLTATTVPTVPSQSCPAGASCVAKPISTYVIGFGIAAGDPRSERIAYGGGTDAPPVGGDHAFYASDEDDLALALSQIIADAQPPAELCNNLDDDCDTLVDEGIAKFCDIPYGINDLELCIEPPETVCDGADDDCDGLIDEGLLNPCGACASPDEICDGMDNDCDGTSDEQVGVLGPCGTDEGICEPGETVCVDGEEVCTGEEGPQPETCNCLDDDCDGFIDEEGDDPLCEGDLVCLGCKCVPPCGLHEEFGATCPEGLRPDVQESGLCVCITDDCDEADCAASMIEQDQMPLCAPDRSDVGTCVCRVGECIPRCAGVSCGSGLACDPRTGACVEDSCRGLGCADGDICHPLDVECVPDACASVSCNAGEACRAGLCEASCASLDCPDGRRCEHGECVVDACAGIDCAGELCDPADGTCKPSQCAGVACARNLVCNPFSGDCEVDACWDVVCPDGESCDDGDCELASTPAPTPAAGAGGAGGPPRKRYVESGGCGCRVGASASSATRAPALVVLFGLVLLLARRRRMAARVPWLVALLMVTATLFGVGCAVERRCINCVDGGVLVDGAVIGEDGRVLTPGDASTASDGSSAGDGGVAGGDGGAVLPTGCEPGAEERCDGKDDDCDFKVDENAIVMMNDCDQLGVCAGTEPVCLNGGPACRYPDGWEQVEAICDGADNDCDGSIDETFDDLGKACLAGAGACSNAGVLECNASGDGLRCSASPMAPGNEVCDGLDNDCDGLVDEPKDAPGADPSYVIDDMVQIGAGLWMYRYEAVRPDASDTAQGVVTSRACSRPGVLPWTNVTFGEAQTACADAGRDLCAETDWIDACEAGAGCGWSYTPASGTCDDYAVDGSTACNGHDITATPGGADDDAVAPTGSFPTCYASTSGGAVFDLSGNVKEWTTENPPVAGQAPLRGGAYNSLPGGMRCDFDFSVGASTLRLPNVGFRCCSSTGP